MRRGAALRGHCAASGEEEARSERHHRAAERADMLALQKRLPAAELREPIAAKRKPEAKGSVVIANQRRDNRDRCTDLRKALESRLSGEEAWRVREREPGASQLRWSARSSGSCTSSERLHNEFRLMRASACWRDAPWCDSLRMRCRGAGLLLSWRASYALSRRRASAVVARRVRQRDVSSSDSDSAT
jgi:hypothetical protein